MKSWLAVTGAMVAGLLIMGMAEIRPADSTDVQIKERSAEGLTLTMVPPQGTTGRAEAQLCDLSGKELASASTRHSGIPVQLRLQSSIATDKPSDYYIRYRFSAEDVFKQKSLFFLSQVLETIVLGQREFLAGTEPILQIHVRDRAVGKPVAGATVRATLTPPNGKPSVFESRTNDRGEAPTPLKLPAEALENVSLRVEVSTLTAHDAIEETVQIRSGTKTLLTTDKPMYQPAQTIHMRALTLRKPDMNAIAKAAVTFEVEDSKGNKVFKKQVETDEYGVSHADFVLADELNLGAYKIRHLVGDLREEKTVTVDRYVLPKFKMQFSTEGKFYQPGDVVKGELQADYFFGKPVADAQVRIVCSKFDVAYVDFQTLDGRTDKNGHFAFETKLPDSFAGQPFEAGKASAKFDVTVIDTVDHREQITRNVTVTANPLIVAAVPEGGDLIAGLENRIFLVATYADSTPAACAVRWANPPGGMPVEVRTDAGGFGELVVKPEPGQPIRMQLQATDNRGNTGASTIELKPREKKGDDTILLRADRALYRAGDEVKLTAYSSRKSGSVYVDVIKDRQTWLTKTLELENGVAAGALTLDVALSGTLEISAYTIGANGVIVRDRRLVIADPANDLSVDVKADGDTYLPGGQAKLSFRVTDKRHRGVAAALGVMVVDEAVFALQEMQPGLEKVYFYLEKEIATPRCEIHGLELEGILPRPIETAVPAPAARREKAAQVLLASAEGSGDYAVNINTYERDNKGGVFQDKMEAAVAGKYEKVMQALIQYWEKHAKEMKESGGKELMLDDLTMGGQLRRSETLDPWGGAMKISGPLCKSNRNGYTFELKSAGIDGLWGTADDVAVTQEQIWKERQERRGGFFLGARRMLAKGMAEQEMVMDAMPMAEMAMPAAVPNASGAAPGSGGAEPPRIRQFFPETLYFNPALITDGSGRALLELPLADSITTWRLTCMANSARGELGSATSGIRVFQDFFVDVDFPVSLTQNDEISVPVAVYNYLKTDQQVRLVAEKGEWFELKGPAEQTVTLKPSEVKAVYFPITAKGIGFQKFTVMAYGAKKSDAVQRSVEVVPDGREELVSFSGRLEGNAVHTVSIPANAIAGASKVFVKVYPGVLSQVVEGLDSMLRMPCGCFEQTSSATYPNVLILDYMKATKKITPELQMKAEGFINSGYQRLVSFEVQGGGFEWFGNAPAHRVLTAYGLMEFFDMGKVFEVDPAIIARTQQWLARCQESDGSFKPSQGGIQEGAINAFTDDVLRTTAYLTWALAHTKYAGPEVAKGVQYIHSRIADLKDPFTLAVAANALVAANAKDENTLKVLQKLFDKRTEEKDVVYWKSQSETPTCGRGGSADIEVTGLAVQAFVQAGRELGAMGKAVNYLAKSKDAFGTWESTQATIQALRAMLMAERGATQKASARIALRMNGQDVKTLTVDDSNSDVLQLVDLKDRTQTGENKVELAFQGEGSLMYQVVGRHYVPRERMIEPKTDPMTISVNYDRTALATDDIIKAAATVTYNQPGKAKMIIVDLGLPPGFTLIPAELDKMVEQKAIQKYSVTGRQIIIYLEELVSGKPVTIPYGLQAKYPLKAKTPKSAVYEYYNPQSRGERAPVELTVVAK